MATRLGLFHTQEELDLYRIRATAGPYVNKGDLPNNWDRDGSPDVAARINSPGDFSSIVTRGNSFKNNTGNHVYNTFWTGANPWTQTPNNGGAYDPKSGRAGLEIASAAFLYMLYKGTTPSNPIGNQTLANSYAVPVINILKDSMNGTGYASYGSPAKPAFNFADTARFANGMQDVNPGFAICGWLLYLINAFEYTQDHANWSTGDKTKFRQWIRDATGWALLNNESSFNSYFKGRPTQDYRSNTNPDTQQPAASSIIYYNGPMHRAVERKYGNRRMTMYGFIGIAGVFLGDFQAGGLVAKAKRWFEEMYMFSIWPTGFQTDGHRGMTTPSGYNSPLTALGYAVQGQMFSFCEALKRTGDNGSSTSFGYDFSTTKGSITQELFDAGGKLFPISGTTADPSDCTGMGTVPKGPRLTLQFLADRWVYRPPYYYMSTISGHNGNFEYLLKGKQLKDGVLSTNYPSLQTQLIMASKHFGRSSGFGQYIKRVARHEYGTIHNGSSIVEGSVPFCDNPDVMGVFDDAYTLSETVGTLFLFDHDIDITPGGGSGSGNQTITFPQPANKTYADAAFSLGATSDSGLTISYSIDTVNSTGTGSISGGNFTIGSVGTIIVHADQPGNGSYNAATRVTRTFTVSKAVVTCTIQNTSRKYNRANPTFSAVYTGFKAGEDASTIDTLATFSCPTASLASDVAAGSGAGGAYPITKLTDAVDNNYSFAYVTGLLTLTKGSLSIAVLSTLNKLTTDPPFTPTIEVNSTDNAGATIVVTGLTTTFSKLSGTSVTSISGAGLVTLSGTAGVSVMRIVIPANTNYFSITNFDRDITVSTGTPTPINQTITGFSPTGGTYGDGTSTLSATGGASGNPVMFTSSDATVATCTGTNGATLTRIKAGTVILTATQAGTTSGTIYNAATPVPVQITIAKKALFVDEDDMIKTYGQPNPILTYTITGGFVGSDTEAVFTVPITLTTNALQNSNVGVYDIYFSGGAADNYSFTSRGDTEDVTLTVIKANQVITGFDTLPEKRANDPVFLLPGTASSGLVITYTKNSGPAEVTVSSAGSVNINGVTGTVNISASQAGNTNYNAATTVTTDLVISAALPLPQVITPNVEILFVFGDADFPVGATSTSGLVVSVAVVDEVAEGTLAAATVPTTCSIDGAGFITLRFSQDGNANFLPASPIDVQVVVRKKSQEITAPTIEDKLSTDPDFSVIASVPSALPLTFTSNNGVLTQAVPGDNPFHIAGVGQASISINQLGNDDYEPVETVRVFNVAPDNPDVIEDIIIGVTGVRGSTAYQSTNRREFFYRFTGIGVAEVNRVVITFKKYNAPPRFKVMIDGGEPVINEIQGSTDREVFDVTLPVAKTTINVIEIRSVGTNLVNVLSLEVYGIR